MDTTWTHEGHTISLTEQHQFIVSGPLFDDDKFDHERTFSRYVEATAAIADRADKKAKSDRAARRVALPALDALGNPIIIKGVHAMHGIALGVPNITAPVRDSAAYPDVPWIKGLLTERKANAERRTVIEQALRNHRISRVRIEYGMKEDFETTIARLEAEHAEKLKAALTADPAV